MKYTMLIAQDWYMREVIILDRLVQYPLVGNFNPKFQPVRNKTNRENTRQRKQSHAQDNIYVVRQFAYVHGVAGISL